MFYNLIWLNMENLNKENYFDNRRSLNDIQKQIEEMTINLKNDVGKINDHLQKYEDKVKCIVQLKHLLGKSVIDDDAWQTQEEYLEGVEYQLKQRYADKAFVSLRREGEKRPFEKTRELFIYDLTNYNSSYNRITLDNVAFNNHNIIVDYFVNTYHDVDRLFQCGITWEEFETDMDVFTEQVWQRALLLTDMELASEEARKQRSAEQEEKRIKEEKELYLKLKEKYGEEIIS